jgi:hypothetical protein
VSFVRFVVGTDAENAARLTGVFTEARILQVHGELYDHESELLEEILDWFNERLPCPPFSAKRRSQEWTRDAVCWFRPDAGAPLARIWDIVAILKEHMVQVRMVTSNKPGKIVYADDYQVVAETPYWA